MKYDLAVGILNRLLLGGVVHLLINPVLEKGLFHPLRQDVFDRPVGEVDLLAQVRVVDLQLAV